MTPEIEATARKSRGRPKTFDRMTAIQQAMKLFWEHGYEGTTFDDLIKAMGISASSFYNTFGSKEQLYREATDAYLALSSKWFSKTLGDDVDAKTAFDRLFSATAHEFTRDDLPAGCMISLAETHVPVQHASLRDMMMTYRSLSESALAARLRKGVEDGDLPPDTNTDSLAAFYSAVARGMAVQARDGASVERLLEIGQLAMQVWPPVLVKKPIRRVPKKKT